MTHYDVLGVATGATVAEVRHAYVLRARAHHPDIVGGDASTMRAINAAWEVLGDPVRRAAYDVEVGVRVPGRGAGGAATSAGHVGTSSRPDDEVRDDDDPRPYAAGIAPPPGWLAVVPVACFAASVATLCTGLVVQVPALLALAVFLFVVASALFFIAPLWAMTRGRARARR